MLALSKLSARGCAERESIPEGVQVQASDYCSVSTEFSGDRERRVLNFQFYRSNRPKNAQIFGPAERYSSRPGRVKRKTTEVCVSKDGSITAVRFFYLLRTMRIHRHKMRIHTGSRDANKLLIGT